MQSVYAVTPDNQYQLATVAPTPVWFKEQGKYVILHFTATK